MLTFWQYLTGSRASGLSLKAGEKVPSRQVNDVHSQLNLTAVDSIVRPNSVDEIQRVVERARRDGKAISIAGARHAMGAQQFGTGTVLIDMTAMHRVLSFDRTRGLIEVEAGIEWPELIDYTVRAQEGQSQQWGIVQKQTGADRLTIGGALAANVHGRGLRYKPIIQDVESFVLIDARGNRLICDRNANAELFRLVIGGYGLFGVVASVTLRLGPRRKTQRIVQMLDIDRLDSAFAQRIADGFLYGDFQFSTETDSERFLRDGVFSCYCPVSNDTPISEDQK